jgi:hypothetical protein
MPEASASSFAAFLADRDDEAVVLQLVGDADDAAVADCIDDLVARLRSADAATERGPLTNTGHARHALERLERGAVLVLVQRVDDPAGETLSPLPTVFAIARYYGVHVLVVTVDDRPLLRRGVDATITFDDGTPVAHEVLPATDDPEQTRTVELGPVED